MAQSAQSLYHLQWQVLICVEARHRSGLRVLSDRLVNLIQVGLGVRPGIDQIGGSKRVSPLARAAMPLRVLRPVSFVL